MRYTQGSCQALLQTLPSRLPNTVPIATFQKRRPVLLLLAAIGCCRRRVPTLHWVPKRPKQLSCAHNTQTHTQLVPYQPPQPRVSEPRQRLQAFVAHQQTQQWCTRMGLDLREEQEEEKEVGDRERGTGLGVQVPLLKGAKKKLSRGRACRR